MPGVITATAKHYAELDRNSGTRKRRRTSLSPADGDEEQDDVEAIDFEVRCDIHIPLSVPEGP
jgi:hypothetical protein